MGKLILVDYPRPGNPTVNTTDEVSIVNIEPDKLIKKIGLRKYEQLVETHASTEIRLSRTQCSILIHKQLRYHIYIKEESK